MLKIIGDVFKLFTKDQRRRFYYLQILVIATAFFEIIGIASIAPFMALVSDTSMLDRDNFLARLFIQFGFQSPHIFIFWIGVGVLLLLLLSSVVSMLTTWMLAIFVARVGAENANRLFTHYLNQSWLFHAGGSSSELLKRIENDSDRVTNFVILPMILMNAKFVLVIFLLVTVVVFDPHIAFSGLLLFGIAYVLLYAFIKNRLARNGSALSSSAAIRYRLLNESFGGIKEILLLNRKSYFLEQFKAASQDFAYARGGNHALSQIPRYFMELLAFGSMIGLVLYFVKSDKESLGIILPILSVYALVGLKLLPAFQQIFSSISQIKGNAAALDALRQDLLESRRLDDEGIKVSEPKNFLSVKPRKFFGLDNVTFTYPGKVQPALENFTMSIPVNSVVGIVGPSGSGKSTAIDILLALIPPASGVLKVDDVVISEKNYKEWQHNIGFVPQTIFISEGTIAENVAFGINKANINLDRVRMALKLAHLDELVESLDLGVHTKVGERGIQLSGGQRQRIGIARAMYHDVSVLIFDEATSALDGVTEKMVMEAIHRFSGQKTIIMIAHRLKTIQKCDKIFYVEQGRVIDQGTYTELISRNENFKNMALYA